MEEIIIGADAGIRAGEDCTVAFQTVFEKIAAIDGEKKLVLEKGRYIIDSDNALGKIMYITNTIGDAEYKSGEKKHFHKVGLYLEGINDLVIEGNGAEIFVKGDMTNIAMVNCKRITLENIAINTENPNMHDFTVTAKSAFSVDFELDKESKYIKEDGKYYFIGKDYKYGFKENCVTAWWTARSRRDNYDCVERKRHPFADSLTIKELSPYNFRVYYPWTGRFAVGDRFTVFPTRRVDVGIFLDRCENIKFKKVAQSFNFSLALVAQLCDTLTFEELNFAPISEHKQIAALADFIQICMCKGKITVKDSFFKGACDDSLNVHGMHFPIKSVDGNRLIVRFAHSQTHGFNAFKEGDIIEYVNKATLLKEGSARVISSELINEYDIALTVDNTDAACTSRAVENITMCPDLVFENNVMDRIITRGLLITTRGKVIVDGNKFLNCSMHNILLSDDAKTWYESGPVKDMTVRNNYFGNCPMNNLDIRPENSLHKGAVHSNILVEGNTFDSQKGGIYIKSAENVIIRGNKITRADAKQFVTLINADNVQSDI